MAEAALDYDYFEPDETLEIPDGGIADFLTAKTGSWADEEVPSSGIAGVKHVVDQLAEYGRFDDEYMVHAAPNETVVPFPVLEANPKLKLALYGQMRAMGLEPERYTVGNELNSINPVTGQREFGIWKKVKKFFKKVVKVVKKIAPIVLPIALSLYPPLGAIYGAMAGSGIASLLQGGSFKDALKAAAISGATAGIMKGLQGGVQGMKPGGPGFTEGFKTSVGEALRPVATQRAAQAATQAAVQDRALDLTDQVSEQLTQSIDAGMQVPDIQTQIPQATNIPQPPAFIPGGPPGAPVAPNIATDGPYTMEVAPGRTRAFLSPDNTQKFTASPTSAKFTASPTSAKFTLPEDSYSQFEDLYRSKFTGLDPATTRYQPPKTSTTLQPPEEVPSFFEGIKRAFTPGDDVGFFEGMGQAFVPEGTTWQEILLDQGINPRDASVSDITQARAWAESGKYNPGWMRRLLPIYGTSMAVAKLSEGRDDDEEEEPLFDPLITGETLLAEDPEKYRVDISPPPPITIQQWEGTGTGPRPSIRWAPPTGAAGGNVASFPPRIGSINGPGTGTSDDVPAMLSDGEFVFTAKAVQGAGNGSRRQGTNNLYSLMRNFEGRV